MLSYKGMTEKVKHYTVDDSLWFLAMRKIEEQEERLQAKAFEELIREIQKKPLNKTEPQSVRDKLWEFIKTIEKFQEDKRTILDIFRRELESIPKQSPKIHNTSRIENKVPYKIPKKIVIQSESPRAPTTVHWLISSLKWIIDRDILSRFPTAYNNYRAMSQDMRDSIYRLSGVFNLGHTQVLWLIANESHFKNDAISPVWASWRMQFMPTTRKWLTRFVQEWNTKKAGPEERFFAALRNNSDFMKIYTASPEHKDLALGIAYLGYLTKRYGEKALRIYNGWINFPDNKENMDYTRRVEEFEEAFEYVIRKESIQYAQK